MKEKYSTLKEEAEDLTRKLRIFNKKFQEGRQEVKIFVIESIHRMKVALNFLAERSGT